MTSKYSILFAAVAGSALTALGAWEFDREKQDHIQKIEIDKRVGRDIGAQHRSVDLAEVVANPRHKVDRRAWRTRLSVGDLNKVNINAFEQGATKGEDCVERLADIADVFPSEHDGSDDLSTEEIERRQTILYKIGAACKLT